MRFKIVLIVLAVILPLSCLSMGDGIYKDFDEFSNRKVITCVVRLKQDRGFDTYKIVFTSNDINSSEKISAYLYTETTIWYYFTKIGFKIDDNPPEYREELKFMRNILPNQKANEIVYFRIFQNEIEEMAKAEKVYFQFEAEKFTVSAEMTPRGIKTLQKYIEELKNS